MKRISVARQEGRRWVGHRWGWVGTTRRLWRLVVLGGALAVAGCEAGEATFLTAEDDIRAENLRLRRQASRYEDQVQLLLAQVHSLEQRIETRSKLVDVPASELPRVTAIKFDRYTGVADSDGDGIGDTLRIYLLTLDQKGRFMPAIGRVAVQAVALRPEQMPLIVAQKTVEPADFDKAYRTGLTGSHYTLEVHLSELLPQEVDRVTVTAIFADADTGTTLTYDQVVPVHSRGSAESP